MGYDRISVLPDSLITQILLLLPTKDSVKTSVLSTRWRNLWLDVPGLELNSNDFHFLDKDAIKNFTERFLELNRDSRLHKFKITYDECNVYLFGISEWIATAINRGTRSLDVGTLRCPYFKDLMPLDIYKSKTLVSLKLVNVGMPNPEFVVSLPCLKIMHLEDIVYGDGDPLILEKIISGCSVLEDLTVYRVCDDNAPVLRVRSHTLKRFCVRSGLEKGLGGVEYSVEIDAPELKYMNFRDDRSGRVVVKNLSSLFTIDVDTTFNFEIGRTLKAEVLKKREIVHDFLTGISSVRHMIISERTLEVLSRSPITKFQNLPRLEAVLCSVLLQTVSIFLKSCPNLKHLILHLDCSWKRKHLEVITSVPRCLLSTLECVEIRNLIKWEVNGKELVKYFLGNSAVLKKLILCFKDSPLTNQGSDIFKELHTFTKRSRRCQIIFR